MMLRNKILYSEDIFRAVSAFELFKTTNNVTFCTRHEHEDDYFDKEEVLIEEYDTQIKSNFYYGFEDIVTFKNFEECYLTKHLRHSLKGMTFPKVLATCARLLIDYHEEKLCSLYMSSAIKFYLKAFELIKNGLIFDNATLNEKTLRFLRFSLKHRLHQDVYIDCLRVFCLPNAFSRNPKAFDYSRILGEVLKITHAAKIDIFSVWNSGKEIDSFIQFYSSLFSDIVNIIPLIHFGRTDCISLTSYFHWRSAFKKLPKNVTTVRSFSPIIVLSLQVLHLYLTVNVGKSHPFVAQYALKLLWNSIRDPYLTPEDFVSSFEPKNAEERTLLKCAGSWYAFHVFKNKSVVRSSRSLLHLSRCSVREQMAKCLQLPSGVERLPLTDTLKNYILLKHCNSSLYDITDIFESP